MKKSELRQIIREEIQLLAEVNITKDIEEKIDEFGELSNEMDKLKHQLEGLKKKYSAIEDELRPILEEMKEFGDKSIQTQKYLVSIKRQGYEAPSYKYKQAFETSLEKVNAQTRKVLEDILESTKGIKKVATSIGAQPVEEGFFSDLVKKVKSFFRKIIPSLRRTNKDIDNLQKLSKKMAK